MFPKQFDHQNGKIAISNESRSFFQNSIKLHTLGYILNCLIGGGVFYYFFRHKGDIFRI